MADVVACRNGLNFTGNTLRQPLNLKTEVCDLERAALAVLANIGRND